MTKILPLGDSLTFGVIDAFGVGDNDNIEDDIRPEQLMQSGGYRTVLWEALTANGFTDVDFVGPETDGPLTIDRDHAGFSGERIDDITERVEDGLLADAFDLNNDTEQNIVLLKIGTNDILADDNLVNAPNRLNTLIDEILTRVPDVQVLVASIATIVENPFSNTGAAEVEAFNTAIETNITALDNPNVQFVDIAAILDTSDISEDGFHITSLGYSKVATAWYNALIPLLNPELLGTRDIPIRVEAETLDLDGYVEQTFPDLSTTPDTPDTPVIQLPAAGTGTATTTIDQLNLPIGTYDVVLGYFDQDAGDGTITVSIGEDNTETLTLNQTLDETGGRNFLRQTVFSDLLISADADIDITGTGQDGELAQVDYLDFIPVNDAPILDNTLIEDLDAIDEDQDLDTINGTLVADILANAATDLDNTQLGIAIVEADTTNGTWQYSIDNGDTWQDFESLNDANALLLTTDDITRIRFIPEADYSGTASISFRAWDGTQGTAGEITDASEFGGSTAFSTDSAATTVTVNDIDAGDDDDDIDDGDDDDDIDDGDDDDDIDVGDDDDDIDVGDDDDDIDVGDDDDDIDAGDDDDDTPDPDLPLVATTLSLQSDNIFTIESDDTPGQTRLRFTQLENDSSQVNEIGVFVADDEQGTINGLAPGEEGYLQQALLRSNVIFSGLPDGLAGDNLTRTLDGFSTGESLVFYLVQDSTTDTVLADLNAGEVPPNVFFATPAANANGVNYLEVSEEDDGFRLSWEDELGGGDEDFNDLVLNVQTTNDAPPLGASLTELIDLREIDLDENGQIDSELTANFTVSSEAAFDNVVGFYLIDDVDGRIGDILPSDEGYAEAAIERRVLSFDSDGTASIELGDGQLGLFAPFIIANGTPEEFLEANPDNSEDDTPLAYFSFLNANPDGVDHVRLLADNTYGFEDLFGGGDFDYNDVVFQVELA